MQSKQLIYINAQIFEFYNDCLMRVSFLMYYKMSLFIVLAFIILNALNKVSLLNQLYFVQIHYYYFQNSYYF